MPRAQAPQVQPWIPVTAATPAAALAAPTGWTDEGPQAQEAADTWFWPPSSTSPPGASAVPGFPPSRDLLLGTSASAPSGPQASPMSSLGGAQAVKTEIGADAVLSSCQGTEKQWAACDAPILCTACVPRNCIWQPWSDWRDFGGCAALGVRSRDIASNNNDCGEPCQGVQEETKVMREFFEAKAVCRATEDRDCEWDAWSEWSRCARCAQCGKDRLAQSVRYRMVHSKALGGGSPCEGPWNQTRACGVDVPVDCAFTEWGEWTQCSATCGGGWKAKLRRVAREAEFGGRPCDGQVRLTVPCGAEPCGQAVDCQVSEWSLWSDCSGEGQRQTYRTRQLIQYPQGAGFPCDKSLAETAGCELVAGATSITWCNVSDWSAWSECPVTCGGGQQMRARQLKGAAKCRAQHRDALAEVRGCNEGSCTPGDCTLSEWSDWGGCSKECGPGVALRARSLISLSAGSCSASLKEAKECVARPCPQADCKWGEWGEWKGCTATCGGGVSLRSRQVVELPREGGMPCMPRDMEEIVPCATWSCSDCIDGEWSRWEDWSDCSATCGPSYRHRHRHLARVNSHCGTPAAGPKDEYSLCEDSASCTADVDCLLTEWTAWGACTGSCDGVQERSRKVLALATGSGQPCVDKALKEIAPCHPGVGLQECVYRVEVKACVLSDWEGWGECSATCGGGQQNRVRQVLAPAQQGGLPCDDVLTETAPCGGGECLDPHVKVDCLWDEWSEWGLCSRQCGGERYRLRSVKQMPNEWGAPCDLGAVKEVQSCNDDCAGVAKGYCAWTPWSDASACSATCGGATKLRLRRLAVLSERPAPEDLFFAGPADLICTGEQTQLAACGAGACDERCTPVDCLFTEWGLWSAPSCTQLCERSRKVYRPPKCGGAPCEGALEETTRCPKDCKAKRDCILGLWSAWSPCKENDLQSKRRRPIVQEAVNEGKLCDASLEETRPCPGDASGEVANGDCLFSEWRDWSQCSRLCGGGSHTRGRRIVRKALGDGKPCEGALEELVDCNTRECAISTIRNCVLEEWSEWSPCNSNNQIVRQRSIHQQADEGGRPCEGSLHQVQPCNIAVDCRVTPWTAWDQCDKPCDGGQRQRHRQVVSNPLHGGLACPPDLVELDGCNQMPCQSEDNCLVSAWAAWSECNAPCGEGYKVRSRDITQKDSNWGSGCLGNLTEVEPCQTASCPCRDCLWGDWQAWTACDRPCGNGQRWRSRDITVWPDIGCKPCDANHKAEAEPCNLGSCDVGTHCVDGQWSDWGSWEACSATCHGGVTWRIRSVKQEANVCGRPAEGLDRQEQSCMVGVHCFTSQDCVFQEWSAWSDCSASCSGVKRRSRDIARHGFGEGKLCEGALEETTPCSFDPKSPLMDWKNPDLYMALSRLGLNNLAGKGPDVLKDTRHPDSMLYTSVATSGSTTVDLLVRATTDYAPQDNSLNGLWGRFANVNVGSTTSVGLSLEIIDAKTGGPVVAEDLQLKFFDLDDTNSGDLEWNISFGVECSEYYLGRESVVKPVGACGPGASVAFVKPVTVNPSCSAGTIPTALDMSRVTEDNLGGQGPGTGPPRIRYSRVAPSTSGSLDLVVEVAPGAAYKTTDATRNGHYQSLGTIDVLPGTRVPLRFTFVKTGTDDAVEMPRFNLTFYDLDSPSGNMRESVTVESPTRWMLRSPSSPLAYELKDASVKVTSTQVDVPSPSTATSVTPQQEQAIVDFFFQSASTVQVALEVLLTGDQPSDPARSQGRVFLFAGSYCGPGFNNTIPGGPPLPYGYGGPTASAVLQRRLQSGFIVDEAPIWAAERLMTPASSAADLCKATKPLSGNFGPASVPREKEQRAVSVRFRQVSKVRVTLSVGKGGCGHNFLFAGKVCLLGGCDPCGARARCTFQPWAAWSACDKDCGGGLQKRSRSYLMEATGKDSCNGSVAVAQSCNTANCTKECKPVECLWGQWRDWSTCSQCGGQRTRSRLVDRPAQCGGRACEQGSSQEMDSCPHNCPQDGSYCTWGDWSPFTPCTATCGQGSSSRERQLKATSTAPAQVMAKFKDHETVLTQVATLQAQRRRRLLTSSACGALGAAAALLALRALALAGSRPRPGLPGALPLPGAADDEDTAA